jgi:hypothetical protein
VRDLFANGVIVVVKKKYGTINKRETQKTSLLISNSLKPKLVKAKVSLFSLKIKNVTRDAVRKVAGRIKVRISGIIQQKSKTESFNFAPCTNISSTTDIRFMENIKNTNTISITRKCDPKLFTMYLK